jgi:molybdate transport system substrate-binding protein
VRAVLAAVEAGRVDAGVIYRTDAMSARVRVIAQAADPDIVQPVAVIAGPMAQEARRFLEFLKGDQARAVFKRRGFGTPALSESKHER